MNALPLQMKVQIISALAEGNAIRAIERMTGVHRDSIMRLGVRIGEGCAKVMDRVMRNIDCPLIQMDEIWGFVGKKQRNATPQDRVAGMGDVWTFVSIAADSKMIPSYFVAQSRDKYSATCFVEDLAGRLATRVQISTDSLHSYIDAVERGFGADADYGQVIKVYGQSDLESQRRYSPAKLIEVKRNVVSGQPDEALISTSYVERQNLTMRMHMRRLTRLTNAFSKKLDNFKAAVSLYFAYYNFCLIHNSLRMTPAMAGGVTDHIWTVEELIEQAA